MGESDGNFSLLYVFCLYEEQIVCIIKTKITYTPSDEYILNFAPFYMLIQVKTVSKLSSDNYKHSHLEIQTVTSQ